MNVSSIFKLLIFPQLNAWKYFTKTNIIYVKFEQRNICNIQFDQQVADNVFANNN